jgi:hypothetical protein
VIDEAGKDETAQLNQLYEVLFSRPPTKEETAALKQFLASQEKLIAERAINSTSGKLELAVPTGVKGAAATNPVHLAAFVDLVHTVVNTNDFAYRF